MTKPGNAIVAQLIDRNGKPVGRCVLPSYPSAPPLILWGNRYFRALYVQYQYIETPCYTVPLENMYATGADVPGAPKGKRGQ
jgi:hypothetical protein